jgi:DNA repair exonuclease SbcCD ATPase subunit
MPEEKQTKTRLPTHDKKRFKQKLGNKSIKQFLNGVIYYYLEDETDEEYYENVAQLHELEGKKAELEGQLEQVEGQLEELRERRDRLEERRDEIEEEIEEISEALKQYDEVDTPTPGSSDVEEVSYDLLVDVAHDEIGTNGVTAGEEAVQQAAVRADVDPDEVIEAMRRVANSVKDSERVEYVDAPLERGFTTYDQRVQERLEDTEFDRVRRAIAEEVLDETDVE